MSLYSQSSNVLSSDCCAVVSITIDYVNKTLTFDLCNIQFVYEGVSFLNEDQENTVRQHITGGDVSNASDRY